MLETKTRELIKAPATKEEKLFHVIKEIHSKTTISVPMKVLMNWGFNLYKELRGESEEVKPEEFRSRLLDLLRSQNVVVISNAIKKIGHDALLNQLCPTDRRTVLLSYFEGLSDLEAAVCCEITEAEYRGQKTDLLLNLALLKSA